MHWTDGTVAGCRGPCEWTGSAVNGTGGQKAVQPDCVPMAALDSVELGHGTQHVERGHEHPRSCLAMERTVVLGHGTQG